MKSLFLTLLIFGFASCSDKPVGSKQRPFTMYFIPSVDQDEIARSGKSLGNFVEKYVSQKLYQKDTGFHVKTAIPTSYIAVVEAFGTNKADFATFNTFSYVLAKDIKKYPIEAALIIKRGRNELTYKGQIVTHVDSGVNSLSDLKNKKFAFTDPASTSGYILPAQLLKDQKIQLKDTTYAHKHDTVITMIYQGQVDAGATYYSPPEITTLADGSIKKEIKDARARVKTQYPDVEEKIKIIAFTQEIPNEPWVLRSNIYEDAQKNAQIKKYVVEAVLEFIKTDEGKRSLNELSTATGLEVANDSMYADIRNLILKSKLDLEEQLKKKK